MMANFVHLHTHSHYSLLDGLGKIDQLVARAKELGMPALALTDHGAMYGAIEFYKTAKSAGLKPIIGVETYLAPRRFSDKTSGEDTHPYHLVLLAKNETGYHNLLKLVSIAHLEGYYYKPRIDKEILKKHSDGLICLTSCLKGEVPRKILAKKLDSAEKLIGEYQEIFGKAHFFLELQDHPEIREQTIANDQMIKMGKRLKVPLVATNDIHYILPQDKEAHDLLICVQTGKTVDDKNRLRYEGDFSMRTPEDIAKAFKALPEAIENTLRIAEACNIELQFGKYLLPEYPLPKSKTADKVLKEWCKKNIKERYGKETSEVLARLNYELDIIRKTGFASYFLIVADLVNFAKEREILVGPGRGSAAGSIVAYLLKITDLDPLKYNLLFERFLNPERISLPDIDIDFADNKRKEVIDYIRVRYGEDRVAGIITFGTMAARAAVRDVGRVLGMPYTEVDQIAKVVPGPAQGRHIPLKQSINLDPGLNRIYREDPRAKKLLDLAQRLEGTIRHASQHACAVVISKDPLTELVPLQLGQEGDIHQITQYSMYPIEELGLLKMDILGLANLTIIQDALEIIEAVHQQKIEIHNLPLDDNPPFQLLGKGETVGVFQLESAGMQRYIKELKPTSLEDISAMVALYRPGPIQWIDSFIRRKHGLEKVEYLHPKVEGALKDTYGIPIYQEQVMQIAKDLAGFTGPEADTLRKAIGKKIRALMREMRRKFVEGAEKNGVSPQVAEEIFTRLEDFAAYGFNRSHAAAYALIAYQTAFLKAHFPECFMAALLTSDFKDIDRVGLEIGECERMGIEVLPPDVNQSFVNFGVVKDALKEGKKQIRFGLSAIKNVGVGVAEAIVKERKQNGSYKNLADFIQRLAAVNEKGGVSYINKKVMEALAKAGALDFLAERNQILLNIDQILKYGSALSKSRHPLQAGLFGEAVLRQDLKLKETPPASAKMRSAWEKELLGIYLSEHPLREIEGNLPSGTRSHTIRELDQDLEGEKVKLVGVISGLKKITTRTRQPMVFAGLEDTTGKTEIIIFPKTLEKNQGLIANERIVQVEGRVSPKEGAIKILVDKIEEFKGKKAKEEELEEIELEPEPKEEDPALGKVESDEGPAYLIELPPRPTRSLLLEIKKVLENHLGDVPVVLKIPEAGSFTRVSTKTKVSPSRELDQAIKAILAI